MFKKFMLLSLLLVGFGCTAIHSQTRAYVTNNADNSVSVIDTTSNTVIATIPVGNSPSGIAAAPDGSHVYVRNQNEETISVIDTANNTAIPITISGLFGGGIPAVSPDSKSVYLPSEILDTVIVLDTATNAVKATIPVGAQPHAVAFTPDGSRAYVANQFSSDVSVIDTATMTVTGPPIPVNNARFLQLELAVTPDGRLVYVTGGGGTTTVIDTATNNTTLIAGPTDAPDLAITPDGATIYLTDVRTRSLSIIDTATNTLHLDVIAVGSAPVFLSITPDGAFVYVPNTADNTVSVVDTASNVVVAVIPAGNVPTDVAIVRVPASRPFAAFDVTNLVIDRHNIQAQAQFTPGNGSTGIDLAQQPLTLTIGTFSLTIPPGNFTPVGENHFVFHGTVNGLDVNFNLNADQGDATQFSCVVEIHGTDQTTQPNPVAVTLRVGQNTGTTSVEWH